MSQSSEGENSLVFTPEEFAAELGFRSTSFLKHLTKRNALGGEVTVIDGNYHVTQTGLDTMKERNRKAREELRYVFENGEEIRRKVARELALEMSGVDEETAKRLGY